MIMMHDFKAEPQALKESMLSAAQRVIESGWYVLGSEVEQFEKLWADICGVSHGVGVANGTDAIEVSLRALGIGEGDEVITTPMTAFATVLAILRAGATPVLADIDPETALLSPSSVERCISKKTKAIVLVHLYGQVRQMNVWLELCKQYSIQLVEDCAQSHLASWNGKVSGSFGCVGAYSFYPTKNLGGIGDAGLLVTNDESVSLSAKSIRNNGQIDRYQHPILGINSRLDELQAAILTERFRWLSEFTARRKEIANAYRAGIDNTNVKQLSNPESPEGHVYHLFVVLSDDRDILQHYLEEQGIQTLAHYPIPIHKQKACVNIIKDSSGLQHAENHAQKCLSLPCHPQMSDQEVEIVIEAINRFSC